MTCNYIIDRALQTLNNYGANPFDAAIAAGAHLSFKDLGSLKGAYFGAMPKPTIVINSNMDEHIQKVVCAHELGHYILHKDLNVSCENIDFSKSTQAGILEREANIFAAAYLVDPKKATELLSMGYTTYECASIMETDVNLLLFLLSTIGVCNTPNSEFLN